MKYFFALIFIIITFSCQKKSDDFSVKPENSSLAQEIHEGKKLMENNCYLCHSPNAPESDGRVGPPMIAIKVFYLEKFPTKTAFKDAIKSFTENPSLENVLLHEDLKKYGLMPKQNFSKGVIEKIADYMFDYQIESPDWFNKSIQSKIPNWTQSGQVDDSQSTPKSYADIGLNYALETKKVLGKNLMGTIQNKGVLEALTFCNHQAMPLTDSLSKHFNATIKRVSDKNRNPNNKAQGEALKMIAFFKDLLKNNKPYEPITIENKNRVDVYYPIETNSMCLQCHGKNIKPEVSQQILKLYPKDLAIGYEENELRGIWHITFDKD